MQRMDTPNCIFCQRTAEAVPLIALQYRGGDFRICTQHLPILVHDPTQLVGLIEGAENLQPSEHRD
jgi:hypothetical protein